MLLDLPNTATQYSLKKEHENTTRVNRATSNSEVLKMKLHPESDCTV